MRLLFFHNPKLTLIVLAASDLQIRRDQFIHGMAIMELKATGERFMPSSNDNIFLEHMHRYRVALQFAAGKDILDIASGEGYGASLLATVARNVIGVDISADAVAHAKRTYLCKNLEFRVGSCVNIPLPDQSVDGVVSFETLEHIAEHHEMMIEVKRVLRPCGFLIISTPERAAYTDATGLTNKFHVKELYRPEFSELISRHFKHLTIHGQRIGFGSIIASEDGTAEVREIDCGTGVVTNGLVAPLYLIAVASDEPSSIFRVNSLFSQEMQASEPVLKRVEFEKRGWDHEMEAYRNALQERYRSDLEFEKRGWDREMEECRNALQERYSSDLEAHYDFLKRLYLAAIRSELRRVASVAEEARAANWMSRVSVRKLLRRTFSSHLLYGLSKAVFWSNKTRDRFLRSARRRDPLVAARKSTDLLQGITSPCLIPEKTPVPIAAPQSAPHPIFKITAIVPNYNHARFLDPRLDSILSQTYPVAEIIILDDASSDSSWEVISRYVSRHPHLIKTIFNETRSGNVFAQWQRGYEAAQGELVWICESDDFCETDFLERLVSSFVDESVMVAFGRVQFSNQEGRVLPGLDHYRELAEVGIWNERVVRPAFEWFSHAFGIKNVIPNVGGSLWRRCPLSPEVWETAKTYKVMGDWYLYLVLSRGGQIAYEPAAVSYFRQHESNTSVDAQRCEYYYKEYGRIMTGIRENWRIPENTVRRFVELCREVYKDANGGTEGFDRILDWRALASVQPKRYHVLISILGFSYGGGELFPIHLANTLSNNNVTVSVLSHFDDVEEATVRRMLSPGVPVYRISKVCRNNPKTFFDCAGVAIVHSHFASIESLLLDEFQIAKPYIVTLHGAYEAMKIPPVDLKRWMKKIDLFAYLTEKNLRPFHGLGAANGKFVKVPNAMPVDNRSFYLDRKAMGIPQDAIVFALVARGAEGKGWPEAVSAFKELTNRRPDREMALLLAGDGPETDKARALAGGHPCIKFLGFQPRVHAIYRLSDVAIAPTRFSGESYPLSLIQAMQVGKPVVATDIGEIGSMITLDGERAGLLIPNSSDDGEFITNVSLGMERMLDSETRVAFSLTARKIGDTFDMEVLAQKYSQIYCSVLASNPTGIFYRAHLARAA